MAIIYPTSPVNGDQVIDSATGVIYTFDAALNAWVKGGSLGGALSWVAVPIAADGDTIFTLGVTMTDAAKMMLFVNGVYYPGSQYIYDDTIDQLTWNGPFDLEASDMMVVGYV